MKPKVAKKASAAAAALLRQATALAPKRLKASDGLLPSAAHLAASPDSDHNTGLAADLTHDPKNGIDCAIIFEELKKDPRVKYLIFQGRIWSKDRAGEGNRFYTGSNPHNKHLHVSIFPSGANDTSNWFPWLRKTKVFKSPDAVIQYLKTRNPRKQEAPSLKENS
jgi:hypothetical protein